MKFFEKNKRIIIALILGCLPLLYAILRPFFDGHSLNSVWIGASEWNDELFYFKQVDAMVKYGIPQGYFGFNESHGLYLTFAAWSPVLLMPWALFGKIFGFSMITPVVVNIIMLSVAMFLFGFYAKLDYVKTAMAAVLFFLFVPFSRYLLSGMPEIIVISLLLIVTALMVGYDEDGVDRGKYGKIIAMFILLFLLTLMRPYLIMFMIVPVFYLVRKTKHGYWISPIVVVATLFVYLIINKAFGAPYFTPLYRTDWLKAFINQGFAGGVLETLRTLKQYGYNVTLNMIDGVVNGLCPGAYFVTHCMFIGIFFIDFIMKLVKKEKGRFISFTMLFTNLGMFFAILLMYKLFEGSKHLLTFIAVDIFVMVAVVNLRKVFSAVLAVSFIWLYMIRALSDYDYAVPYRDETHEEIAELSKEIAPDMILTGDVSWDNTVALVFYDTDKYSGEAVMTAWQQLYAIPAGYGISFCTDEYLLENMSDLKCKYLVSPADGVVGDTAINKGATVVGENNKVKIIDLSTMRIYE